MLRITHSKSAAGAEQYYDDGLSKSDYHSEGSKTLGQWGGKAAERLGLSGAVERKDFVALCNNETPDGSKLNPRQGKRVYYDFTYSCPKSVSLAYALTQDEQIREAFERAVRDTMEELEQEAHTQQRKDGKNAYLQTGELVYATFVHKTSRPVGGIPDPHLHCHAVTMNTSWNESKQRFQRLEASIIKRQAPYFEAACDSRLAFRLKQLGYAIEHRGYSWELAGLEKSTLNKFSRRTSQVETRAAKEQKERAEQEAKSLLQAGETNQGTPPLFTAARKAALGAITRAKKVAGQSWEVLCKVWKSWMNEEENQRFSKAVAGDHAAEKKTKMLAHEAVNKAVSSLFERKSSVLEYQLKADALKRSYGEVLPEEIHQVMQDRAFFYRQKRNYLTHITTEEAVRDEYRLLDYLRQGIGTQKPINPTYQPEADFLNEEQKAAVQHALTDTNQVSIISGGAGVGKTTLMKEVKNGIEQGGHKLFCFAPTAKASRGVMRQEGFEQAETVARLLVDPALQNQTRNAVLWIDEAGLLGNKQMLQVFEIAKKQNARILLTGDTRQHTAVARGDALRILESGGVKVARVNQIQRQKKSPLFKKVVRLASKGKIDAALYRLDQLGGVVENCNRAARTQKLVDDYTKAVAEGKSTLVISPTHREGRQITRAIRDRLKAEGMIEKEERRFAKFKNLQWTEADRASEDQMLRSLDAGKQLALVYHQNAKGKIRKGQAYAVRLSEHDLGKNVMLDSQEKSELFPPASRQC